MFFWRHDGQFLKRSERRLRSPRGAVFTEFAFIAPILVLLVSAMIELVSYWDARIMANHTAWTIGRQVAVYGTNLRFGEEPDWIKKGIGSGCSETVRKTFLDPVNGAIKGAAEKLNDRGMITAAFLMSTCGMGYFGTTPGQEVGDFLKKFTDPLQKLMDELAKSVESVGSGLESLKSPFSSGGFPEQLNFGGILDKITKFISETIIDGILTEVIKPLQKALVTNLNEKIDKVVVPWINKLLSGPGNTKRRFRQAFGAFTRVSQVKDIIRFEEYGNSTKLGGTTYRCFSRNQPLDFPQTFTEENMDSKRIGGWPPYHQTHGLVKVTVAWPFSTGWLFPVVSGFRKNEGSITDPVRATGYSLVFQQPAINNDNLRSVGAVTFDVGTTNLVDAAVKDTMSEAKKYFSMVAFGYRYRLGEETVFVFDPRPTSPFSRKYLKPICDWYDFQDGKGGYDRKKAQNTEDYDKSWRDITGQSMYLIFMTSANEYVHGDKEGMGTAYLGKEWLHIFSDSSHNKARHRYGGVKNARSHFYTYSLGSKPGSGESIATRPLYLGTRDEAYGQIGGLPTGFDGTGGATGAAAGLTNSNAGVNMDLWLSIYRPDDKDADVKAEAELLKKTLDINTKMTDLESALRTYASEIEDSMAGGGREGAACGIVPDIDGVDITDPKAVAKWMDEKIKKIKDETLPLYNKIDDALVDFRKAFDEHNKKAAALLQKRSDELRDMFQSIGSILPGGTEGSAEQAKTIRELLQGIGKGTSSYNPQTEIKELDNGLKDITDKMDELFKLETDYAKAFGSLLASRYAGKGIGEIDWGLERQHLAGDQYGKSGFTGGNDDDMVGDEWKLGEGGWK